MVQSREILGSFFPLEFLDQTSSSLIQSFVKEIAKNDFPEGEGLATFLAGQEVNALGLSVGKINEGISFLGSGITLTKNERKYIIRGTRSLENRKKLLKGTTRKVSSRERGFLKFRRPLLAAGLPLMKMYLHH